MNSISVRTPGVGRSDARLGCLPLGEIHKHKHGTDIPGNITRLNLGFEPMFMAAFRQVVTGAPHMACRPLPLFRQQENAPVAVAWGYRCLGGGPAVSSGRP